MIKLTKVSKKFGKGKSKTTILDDVNLTIKKGQFLAIMGPSGSGKTTLLNMLGGLDKPTSGSITVNEKEIHLLSDKELSRYRNKEIGFIFQEFYLESALTVKENVLLPTFFNHKTKEDEIYAGKLIREVGLTPKINNKITELSGGQKQRTAIARALINRPQIIIADEPTGNLDAKTGETIIKLLKDLHKIHEVTLIIATHDEKIAKAAQKIIKIKDGKCS